MEVHTRLQPGARLEHLAQVCVRRPGIGGGLQHHQRALLQVARDRFASLEDVGNVRLPILVQRRGHAEDDRRHFLHPPKIGGRRKSPGLHGIANGGRWNMFDIAATRIDRGHLCPVNVQPDDFHFVPGKLQAQRQPDITQSDDGNFHDLMARPFAPEDARCPPMFNPKHSRKRSSSPPRDLPGPPNTGLLSGP